MTDDPALIQAILDDPDDDGVRLVYADWLEEHGQPERGEFIRVQCELARRGEDDPRRNQLLQREDALLRRDRDEWLAPLRAVLDRPHSRLARLWRSVAGRTPRHWEHWPWERRYGVHFRRGFTEDLFFAANEFASLAPALFVAAPVLHEFGLGGDPPDLPRLFGSPWLTRVQRLYLDWALGEAGTEFLVGSPHLGHLRELTIPEHRGNADCVRLLASSTLLSRLTSLTLWTGCPRGEGGWPEGRLGAEAIRALAESPGCQRLQRLQLGYHAAGDSGATALASSPYLSNLQVLGLNNNFIGDDGAIALAWSPYLSGLRVLSLLGNEIGDAGARALAASTTLAGLRVLDLRSNRFGRAAAVALAVRFGDRVLFPRPYWGP
jgi:uncharacterized protein (TIGR02996 family)